ncbi:hypothetical protein K7472_14325 [Streptomyces sp. PTM05]|uniref:Uncharacterized protein n=1 Tax=Streptantibioticus parmotrematis TaxID=2873249 RepID=A0ABS7QS63_9ACTN|nr:hypothetical protein [Streptantibioticus parmotrematis]MBY8886025.1 hypothetical protein [Streptantibioticus parmotrematis]
MKKKTLAMAFAAALLTAGGAGAASAAAVPQQQPAHPTGSTATATTTPKGATTSTPKGAAGATSKGTTFHCSHPNRTFTISADPWVMGQYEAYYGQQGCTHTP